MTGRESERDSEEQRGRERVGERCVGERVSESVRDWKGEKNRQTDLSESEWKKDRVRNSEKVEGRKSKGSDTF